MTPPSEDKMDSEVEEVKKEYFICPFCKDDDFDLPGLKYHLTVHCKIYSDLDISDWH